MFQTGIAHSAYEISRSDGPDISRQQGGEDIVHNVPCHLTVMNQPVGEYQHSLIVVSEELFYVIYCRHTSI